MAKTLLITQLH